jgi:hypothetical protein
MVYLPLIRQGPHVKRRRQQLFVATGTCLRRLSLAMTGIYGLIPFIARQRLISDIHARKQFSYCSMYSLPRECVYLVFT